MAAFQYYYQTEDDFELQIHRQLKLTTCPNCKRIGNLILNGLIRSYSESSPLRIICGHYVLCNHRRKGRRGCGKSFSVFLVKKIKYHSISTQSLWKFLHPSAYLRMRVLGAIDLAPGKSIRERIKEVSNTTFTDEEGTKKDWHSPCSTPMSYGRQIPCTGLM